ncbi:hypothetical protein Nepgr_024978 [Nepenthes gracilis]|uniref:Uncharacterized protein n=1 Tax=Nepenthes gracilis TaxID=150966 RepID=A0AAD3T486_NEPGR|nr:hypothetical protein Nepgr_024978 [Nepenthes gracilis]
MCILCVIQKWSRRIATMLPWLVIPLIGLWALSQLLPPAFRFEITSPRLACVFVLLATLFWYEVLMPQLSAWRVRRNARLRERKRFEALELQKLKKTATRKCRNCLTPYRDQNPGGGKFMCSYCGHISKRPVLDLPIPPGLGMSNSGIIKDLFGRSGKILNGKVWSDNESMCPVWLEHGNWEDGGSFAEKSTYQKKNVGFFDGNGQWLDDKSSPHAYLFICKWLMSFLRGIRWLWRKLFRVSSSRDDALSEAEQRVVLAKNGENGGTYHESRGEKARRKTEEKRQARLDKELLEEEERQQREEVARLVEERRRQRDEKMEAENRARGLSSLRQKDKNEAEKKRQCRKKEKDKGSTKSNSDAEELDKKVGKENEKKWDTEKRGDSDKREPLKTGMHIIKSQSGEAGQGVRSNSVNSGRGNAGSRYLDRMRGTFLSSSRAFTGGSFFGRAGRTPSVSKDSKSSGSIDHFQVSGNRKELCPPERASLKVATSGDDKNVNRPVFLEPQHKTAPKSWQQLFTKSEAVPAPSNANVISRPSVKPQAEVPNSQLPCQLPSAPTYDNPIDFGFPSPFNLPTITDGSMSNISCLPPMKDPMFPCAVNTSHDLLPEEPELFEDPCYVPDPVSLLGPVSESLDNFQLDLGTSVVAEELENPCRLMNLSSSFETSRPSHIESPISQLRVADERKNISNHLPASPNVQDMYRFPAGDLNTTREMGTWQMWNSSPLGQDGLGLVGGPANWILPSEHSRSSREDIIHPSSRKTMASLFAKDDPVASGTYSPQKIFLGNSPTSGAFSSSVTVLNDRDPWLQKTIFPPLSVGETHFPINHPIEDTSQTVAYSSPSRCDANHPVDLSPAHSWTTNEWKGQGSSGGGGNPPVVDPHGGGLRSTPDLQPPCAVCCGNYRPDVVDATGSQSWRLRHSAVAYLNTVRAEKAEALASKFPGDLKVVVFMSCGTEANELAMLMARLYTWCHDIISLSNSYHGNTAATMGATAQFNLKFDSGIHHAVSPDPYRGVFGSDGEKYTKDVQGIIDFGTSGHLGGFLSEAILGVGGIIDLAPGYLPAVYNAHGAVPDIVTMAKSIGNGVPLG